VQYAPPEFFNEELPLTEKSDVWFIGVTLWYVDRAASVHWSLHTQIN
jgi:hypothetical protein